MGVKRARLLLAARLLILCRQARGLAVLPNSCLQNRIQHRSRTDFSIDLTYSHEWDETDSTFKPFGHGRAIASRMGIHVQTIQQRGQVSVALDSGTLDRTMTWVEEWLCPALVVEGTRGLHLLPAVHRFFPKEFLLTGSVETLKKTLASVDSFTFAPCSDAASGNVVVMKAWGHLIESIRRLVGPRLLFLPDTCQVHSHQRGKASMKAVKVRLSRHYSMSQLLRRETVLEAIGKAMKKDIHYRVTRKFEPPPEVHKTRFFKAVDVLYNITNPELDKHGKVPLVIVNLRKLAQMVNDDVSAEDWYHYCWRGEGLTPEAPCCESDDACETEICKVVLDCLYGRTEQTPGEGRWTYLLSAFKRTILRKLVHGVGVIHKGMFPNIRKRPRSPANAPGVDEEPDEQLVNAVRMDKTCDHLASGKTFHELGLHCITQGVCGRLFYQLLGGSDRLQPPR